MSDAEKEETDKEYDETKNETDTDDLDVDLNTDLSETEQLPVDNSEKVNKSDTDERNENKTEEYIDASGEGENEIQENKDEESLETAQLNVVEDSNTNADEKNENLEMMDDNENLEMMDDNENHNKSQVISKRESVASATFIVNLETLDELPVNVKSIFLSNPTLQVFNVNPDDEAFKSNPIMKLSKEDIIKDMQQRAAVSDFSVIKNDIKSYNGEEIMLVYDEDFKFGNNFIIAMNEEAKQQLSEIIITRIEARKMSSVGSTGNVPEETDTLPEMMTGSYEPPVPKPWVSLGSDKEIENTKIVLTRNFMKTLIQRPKKEFGAPVQFGVKPAKKDYVEIESYEDNSFTLKRMEEDKNESNAPEKKEIGTNTTWKYPRNAFTQYEPRKISAEECDAHLQTEEMLKDTRSALPFIIETIQQNEIANCFIDDYGVLQPGDTVFDNKANNNLREFQTFADLRFGKEKAISHIEWHPSIKGVIATSMTEKTSFDVRTDNLSKVILTKSYIIIWSFIDPMTPQLLLEAPADVYCFQFNPTDPHIVAGGCINGQVLLWDIENYIDDLKNVKAKLKAKNNTSTFSFVTEDGPKVPKVRCVAVSHIESSHSSPVTDLQWLPDHYEINNLGYSKENLGMKSVQFATAANDNKLYFWDIREKKSNTVTTVDKASQPIPLGNNSGIPETYRFLDMKWKPTLKVHLFKTSPGGDFAPSKFSLKEVQGDRHVLNELESNKGTDDEPVKPGKERTLQSVNTHIYVGTEDGELVYVDWMPQKDADSAKYTTPKPDYFWTVHDGPVTAVERSPFDRGLILVVGGWRWSIWKEGINSGPILQCCTSVKPLTGGIWSMTKSSVFFIMRADGNVEIWDLLDKTHEPTLVQNISSSASLTSISLHNFVKKQLLAIGDINGTLHIYEVPSRFRLSPASELADTLKYVEREVRRRDFVQTRWNMREKEKIEKENEAKRKAGIAPQVVLTDEEIHQRMKNDYNAFLQEESAFLREMGLKEDSDSEEEGFGITGAPPMTVA